ncbi:MAG TPA: hypothetical protein VNE39_29520 [Planctomycetota bacterium]|nr:hypothetical protein [Planctomycetota bacterium]
MSRFLRRVFGKHANALGFWAVAVLIALALTLAVALVRGRLG